jgi:ribosome-associated protein
VARGRRRRTDRPDHPEAVPTSRPIAIRDSDIRLGQLLKLADCVQRGSDVKDLLGAGEVRVNGVVETRRGRKIAQGDTVLVNGQLLRVV